MMDTKSYGSWVSFSDPDENSWYAQYMVNEREGQVKGEGEVGGR